MSSTTHAAAALMLAIAIVLSGCAQKPPECGDPKTLETIQSLTVDNARGMLLRVPRSEIYKDDPGNIQQGYFKSLKTNVAQIVSDGYNKDARKNSCRGKLSIFTASGQSLSREVSYTTQLTQDKDGGFLVEIAQYSPFIEGVVGDFIQHFEVKRYSGQWTGTYACDGIGGESSGPQGPFSMNVMLAVDPNSRALLERTSRGGGVERLSGEVSSGGVRLVGEGQNSPDDTWRTVFEGGVKGLELSARGQITSDGRLLRSCSLSLNHVKQ